MCIKVLELIMVIVIAAEPRGTLKRAETVSAGVGMVRYAGMDLGVVFHG
jgi:hypothetical protein